MFEITEDRIELNAMTIDLTIAGELRKRRRQVDRIIGRLLDLLDAFAKRRARGKLRKRDTRLRQDVGHERLHRARNAFREELELFDFFEAEIFGTLGFRLLVIHGELRVLLFELFDLALKTLAHLELCHALGVDPGQRITSLPQLGLATIGHVAKNAYPAQDLAPILRQR